MRVAVEVLMADEVNPFAPPPARVCAMSVTANYALQPVAESCRIPNFKPGSGSAATVPFL